MKQLIMLACLISMQAALTAQINVRVRSTGNTKEADVKIGGSPGRTKATNTQPAGDTKTAPAAAQPVPAAGDSLPKPAATGSFDESYNGPAKVQLKAFWRQMDKLRAGDMGALNNAERMLGQVKQNDPNYNVAELEKEVAGYRAMVNKDAAEKNAAAGKAQDEKEYFNSVWLKMTGVYSKGIDIQPGITGKAYYDRVQALNLAEYHEKKAAATSAEAKKIAGQIDAVLADYDEYVKRADRLKWNVTEVMVKARNEANPQEKIKRLEQARYECEAVLVMSPGNVPFKEKLAEVNKLLGNAGAEASKNYTSDFHKQNVGKIVWSNQPLVIGKEKDMTANIKTAFKTGDAIFGTIYLGNTAKQLMNGNEMLRVKIRVDGGTAIWGGDLSYFILPLTVQDKTYIQFALLPDEAWFNAGYAPYIKAENWTYSYLMDELANAGDVSHQVTCEFDFPTNIQGNIKGSLSLDLNEGSSAIKALSAKLHNQLMASRTLPKAGMNNAALEQQIVTAANNLGWNDKFSKAIITSSSWTAAKNELTGAILYRWVAAVCTIKGTDGKCYYQEFSFKQDYSGGGNYSSTVKFNSYGSKREIGCDKIK